MDIDLAGIAAIIMAISSLIVSFTKFGKAKKDLNEFSGNIEKDLNGLNEFSGNMKKDLDDFKNQFDKNFNDHLLNKNTMHSIHRLGKFISEDDRDALDACMNNILINHSAFSRTLKNDMFRNRNSIIDDVKRMLKPLDEQLEDLKIDLQNKTMELQLIKDS